MQEIFVGPCMPYMFKEWAKQYESIYYEFRIFKDQEKARRIIGVAGKPYNAAIPFKKIYPVATHIRYYAPLSDTYMLFENEDDLIVFIFKFGELLPKYKPLGNEYGSIQRYSAVDR